MIHHRLKVKVVAVARSARYKLILDQNGFTPLALLQMYPEHGELEFHLDFFFNCKIHNIKILIRINNFGHYGPASLTENSSAL